MTVRSLVVIGGSAGAIEPAQEIMSALPADLSAAVLVVIHRPAGRESRLPQILTKAGPLTALQPSDGDPLEEGCVYIAPPDKNMLVRDAHIRLSRGPLENHSRPAIDPLFRSAAVTYGPRVVAVLLSGILDDGTSGALAVKRAGGSVIVQDPQDAMFPDIPRSAINIVEVDSILRPERIGPAIVDLVRTPPRHGEGEMERAPQDELKTETSENRPGAAMELHEQGVPSVYSCPDCGGVLWEIDDGEVMRYRCRVGHAYSIDGLMDQQGTNVETAFWVALRAIEEHADLARGVARRMRKSGHVDAVRRLERRVARLEEQADLLRTTIDGGVNVQLDEIGEPGGREEESA